MNENSSLDFTYDVLFRLIKRFPPLKVRTSALNGLTQSEHRLLATLMLNLDDEHTALSVTEVSNLLQITPAGVTHLANSLEKAGYIERLSAPNDRRLVLVGLTDRGRKAAEALIADVQAQLSGLLNHLGEDDGQAFMRLIARAIDYFESQFEA